MASTPNASVAEVETLSAAERFAAARERTKLANSALGSFASTLTFALDDFQLAACRAVEAGNGVLVAAPTGAGKTIVGEFAVFLALRTGKKAFYTAPIKALSNQKYTELAATYGSDNVGLLTGDSAINAGAPIVVMTTEVLRNMLYAGSEALRNLAYVVMDEVHYLADRFRGAVWEEVIIHLPDSVQLVSLSATVSNAEEFGAWLDTVRGSTEVVVSEHRPVPLSQNMLVGNSLFDLFASERAGMAITGRDRRVNKDLLELAKREAQERSREKYSRNRTQRGRRGRSHEERPARRSRPTRRSDVIRVLDEADLLPAITFIFSRAGCDAAVRQCLEHGISLTTEAERRVIEAAIAHVSADIPPSDLAVLGFHTWREGMIRGIAAHHAGLLPSFKKAVETLFAQGLIRAVFATETLALGVNMPARSVVIEKLEKFNGESHVEITPGEYTQLTGRAGRRGIDTEGHAVVLWHEGTDPTHVAGLASKRSYPLNSSFQPSYNMSINLISQFGPERSREILQSSFAQFQADRSVVGLARQVRGIDESMAGYEESMKCHLGDFTEYYSLRQELTRLEKSSSQNRGRNRRAAIEDSLADLRVGDVLSLGQGGERTLAVVIRVQPNAREPRPEVLTTQQRTLRLNWSELAGPVRSVGWIKVPKGFDPRAALERKALAGQVLDLGKTLPQAQESTRFVPAKSDDEHISKLRAQLRAHPCHGCSDREAHARWWQRWFDLKKQRDKLIGQIRGRTGSIVTMFDKITELLTAEGFLSQEPLAPTPDGDRLRRIYGERDLLIALCLREGALNALNTDELAAFASCFVYQAKRESTELAMRFPSVAIESACKTLVREWSALDDLEEQYSLPHTPEPDFGLIWPIHGWARGQSLQTVLEGTDLAAGDFVRWIKQVVDVLEQLAGVPDIEPQLRKKARSAIEKIRRGVVGYSSVLD